MVFVGPDAQRANESLIDGFETDPVGAVTKEDSNMKNLIPPCSASIGPVKGYVDLIRNRFSSLDYCIRIIAGVKARFYLRNYFN